jgi:hypothetical protein
MKGERLLLEFFEEEFTAGGQRGNG